MKVNKVSKVASTYAIRDPIAHSSNTISDSNSNQDILLGKNEVEPSASNRRRSSRIRALHYPGGSWSVPANPKAHSSPSATVTKDVEPSSCNTEHKSAVPKDLQKEVGNSEDSMVDSMKKEVDQKKCVSKIPVKQMMEQLYSDSPVYHIRMEDHDDEQKQAVEKCILCNKDLSCLPNGVDRGSCADDEYKFRIRFIPLYLPAVDMLPCGHVIHTECSKYAMSAESNVPLCVLCLSMP